MNRSILMQHQGCPEGRDEDLSYIHDIWENRSPELCPDCTFRNDINRFSKNFLKINLQSRVIKKAGIITEINQNINVTPLPGFVTDDRAKDANPGYMILLDEIRSFLF